MKKFIEFIDDAMLPTIAIEALNDKVNGTLDKIVIEKIPLLGVIVIGQMKDPENDKVYGDKPKFICPELEVLKVSFQQVFPRDETGFGGMNENDGTNLTGLPIRIFIGTIYTGIILQYNHENKTWYSCYSHGNFGKNCTHGGTWSSGALYGEVKKTGKSCEEAICDRVNFSKKHIYSKNGYKKEEFCISSDFWEAVRRDLVTLGLI